ncbi:unnamed protein product [Peronospora destructor]|uniref:Uncharacterized protein n=1 Tax=Peronospora destructor TaxID=86335 RepID=A0AAV0UBP1_9STRA|nr:unnamed protein product [Peronospora destructor]
MQPDRDGYAAPLPCGSELAFSTGPCPLIDDCTPDRADSVMSAGVAENSATTAAVPMERRRLTDVDDEDQRELAELRQLVDEDELGTLPQRSGHPQPALYQPPFASLRRHRDSRHRRIAFTDRFSAGCACGIPFTSRLAAANHANACASLSDTPSATVLAAGDFIPTAVAVNATATVADLPARLPFQDSSVLAVSPPHASITADTLEVSRSSPPLPRPLIASRVASHLAEVPTPRWGPLLPRSVVVSRIADRLLPPELLEEEESKADDSDDVGEAAGDTGE